MQGQLIAMGRYAPSHVLDNAWFEASLDTTAAWIEERTGIRRRHVVTEETPSQLAFCAWQQMLARHGEVDPRLISLLVVATTLGDYIAPATACVLQDRIGAVNAMAFDITATCSGFLYGLRLALDHLAGARLPFALVVASETMSHVTDYTDRRSAILFGDAAAVALIKATSGEGNVRALVCRSHGCHHEVLGIPGGGAAVPFSRDVLDRHLNTVRIGQETRDIGTRLMIEAAREALAQAGITAAQVDHFIPHQANAQMMQAVARELGLESRLISTVAEYGNTSAASIPFALDMAMAAGRIRSGELVLAASFGSGATSAGLVLEAP
jgi:3-oxoacyl-[acyl-carrier-protein] synthase-3